MNDWVECHLKTELGMVQSQQNNSRIKKISCASRLAPQKKVLNFFVLFVDSFQGLLSDHAGGKQCQVQNPELPHAEPVFQSFESTSGLKFEPWHFVVLGAPQGDTYKKMFYFSVPQTSDNYMETLSLK